MRALSLKFKTPLAIAFWLVLGGVAMAQQAKPYEPEVGQDGKDVVWVPTPDALVEKMLDMAKVTSRDFVIDLGSGDGRTVIAAAKRGARALGIEYNPDMVELSTRNAAKAGVSDRASFKRADLFESDFSQAQVITMFLLSSINLKLRPKILDLAPGTRIVSNTFDMGDWRPEQRTERSYFWIVPARVAGRWESQVETGGRPVPWPFTFQQNFQLVHGSARAGERSLKVPQFRLSGEQLAFRLEIPAPDKPVTYQFRGRVREDVIEGTVTMGSGSGQRVMPWTAKQTLRGEPNMGAAGSIVVADGAR